MNVWKGPTYEYIPYQQRMEIVGNISQGYISYAIRARILLLYMYLLEEVSNIFTIHCI